jgi:hypothetical protein
MSDDFDVKDALKTDKLSLDYEFERQASLYEKVTSILSDITYNRDRAKAKLSYESAKLANAIRSDVDEYNIIGNATDAKVKEIVTCDDKIRQLERIYHEWEAEVIAADGVKWALDHKKMSLKELSNLYSSGYWAKPYVSGESGRNHTMSDDQQEALANNPRMIKRGELKEK